MLHEQRFCLEFAFLQNFNLCCLLQGWWALWARRCSSVLVMRCRWCSDFGLFSSRGLGLWDYFCFPIASWKKCFSFNKVLETISLHASSIFTFPMLLPFLPALPSRFPLWGWRWRHKKGRCSAWDGWRSEWGNGSRKLEGEWKPCSRACRWPFPPCSAAATLCFRMGDPRKELEVWSERVTVILLILYGRCSRV